MANRLDPDQMLHFVENRAYDLAYTACFDRPAQILRVNTVNQVFSCLVKTSADNILVYFFLFFPENRLWHLMQIVSTEKNKKNIINLSSPEIYQRVVTAKYADKFVLI